MPVCSAHKMGVELAPSRSSLHNPFILAKSMLCRFLLYILLKESDVGVINLTLLKSLCGNVRLRFRIEDF